MTIPYSDNKHEHEETTNKPSAPPDFLDDAAAPTTSYGTTSTTMKTNAPPATYDYEDYDPESLLPIATPVLSSQQDDYKQQQQQLQQEPPLMTAHVLGFDDSYTRMVFIRKVYSILAIQLVLTGGVCAWMICHVPTQMYVLTHAWPTLTCIVLSFVLIIALMCYKTQYPQNAILLGCFTFVEAFLVGTVTTAYCATGYKGVVLEAVCITAIIFVGLTLFTFQSKIDFSFLGAGLAMGLGVLIVWGILSLIFGLNAGYFYALLGCIIFSGYILFDTWLLMEKLSPDEYILAAISLYLDLVNLFLYMLRLLSSSDNN